MLPPHSSSMVGPGLSMKWFPTIAPSRPMISAPNHRDWMVLLLSGKPGPVRASFAHCNGESAPHVTPGNGCANVTSKAALPCSPAAVTTTPLAEGRPDSALGFHTWTTSPFRGTEFHCHKQSLRNLHVQSVVGSAVVQPSTNQAPHCGGDYLHSSA